MILYYIFKHNIYDFFMEARYTKISYRSVIKPKLLAQPKCELEEFFLGILRTTDKIEKSFTVSFDFIIKNVSTNNARL